MRARDLVEAAERGTFGSSALSVPEQLYPKGWLERADVTAAGRTTTYSAVVDALLQRGYDHTRARAAILAACKAGTMRITGETVEFLTPVA